MPKDEVQLLNKAADRFLDNRRVGNCPPGSCFRLAKRLFLVIDQRQFAYNPDDPQLNVVDVDNGEMCRFSLALPVTEWYPSLYAFWKAMR